MARRLKSVHLKTEIATRKFACALGAVLARGDIVLLRGDIGTGKSFIARAVIQSLQQQPEDIPSPTFTLVQTYETHVGEIWHADLYRLSSVGEVEELGLLEVFDSAICLIEWPDILRTLIPEKALEIDIAYAFQNEERQLALLYEEHFWSKRLEEMVDDT